ncbi:MAG: hypothetical protein M0Z52_13150 [Actinomycetota bacterium]|nr:hypothetical protein [Actinomycetota bacterium]
MKKVPFIKLPAREAEYPRILLAGLLFLFSFLIASAGHAQTAPGTVIDNQAFVTYTDAGGNNQIIYSNKVEAIVQPVVIGALVKSASNYNPLPGGAETFTLSEDNPGAVPITGADVTIDGTPQQLVIIRDQIPANSTFSSFVSSGGGTPLYHALGAPAQTYTTSAPAGTIDAVAFGFSSIAPGVTVNVSFSVQISNVASGTIINTGQIYYSGGPASGSNSNTITLSVAGTATIQFYSSSSFTNSIGAVPLGGPLFIQAKAAACNTNPAQLATAQITLADNQTGDVETYTATETGLNTGVFRIFNYSSSGLAQYVATANAATTPVVKGDGIIEALPDNTLTATITGCGYSPTSAQSIVLVDPFGVAFDSGTNAPIANAVVTLVDVTGQGNGGNPGGPAKVFQYDGSTPAPATITTDLTGTFQFPLVPPSTYKISVLAPNGHSFPSKLQPGQLPAGRTVLVPGSYGGNFQVGPSMEPVKVDIPLDPGPASGLFINKTGSTQTAELGDFVDYTVTIKNSSGLQMTNIILSDNLPAGFVYANGTARLDGAQIPDPAGTPGPNLIFQVGTMASGASHTLTYRVRIGPGASNGNGTNTAVATASGGTVSNESQWTVTLTGGVFSDKGIIFGKVFADCNGNKTQDKGEPGIPGVALYLEDGTYAITDSEGKYSIYGIDPATHVLKVDNTTLPEGARLEVLTNRNAEDPNSLFVDLKAGDMHRADFAVKGCQGPLLNVIKSRIAQSGGVLTEADRRTGQQLQPEPAQTDSASLPASGLADSGIKMPDYKNKPAVTKAAVDDGILPDDDEQDNFDPARLKDMDNTLGFIDMNDGDVLPYSQMNITVKGGIGRFQLSVNGAVVPESKVGLKSVLQAKQVQAWEYIGIDLKPGVNELKLTQYDQFGNKRGEKLIKVTAPGPLARIRLTLPKGDLKADGKSILPVKIELLDSQGLPVLIKTALTLKANGGAVWQVDKKSADGNQAGASPVNGAASEVHVSIDGGKGTYMLLAPNGPGNTVLTAGAGDVKSEQKVFFGPNLRPFMAVGVVEGSLDLSKLDPSHIVPARQSDGFDQELRNIAFNSDGGKLHGAARGALYLKGKVLGKYLLTLAYDSNKQAGERLFRDIQPDEFYPVYGDSSIRGYDAQSTGKLYVRVDEGRSYMLYGDYATGAQDDTVKLGAYSRSLNGVQSHYENKKVTATAFTSQNTSRQVIEEIPANGTSGPYQLSNTDITENSEQVELVTRDRNQPSLILATVAEARFTDYELEPFTGRLLFKAPIPSVDENLNPVFIRVTYEVDQGGQKFWTAGAQAQAKITNAVQVGGAFTKDFNPQGSTEIESADSKVNLGKGTYVTGEVARTVTTTGIGGAERVEFFHEGGGLTVRANVVRTGLGFNNPSSGFSPGRLDAMGKLDYVLSKRDLLKMDLLHSQDLTTGGRQEGLYAGYVRTFKYLAAEFGMRYARETAATAQATTIGATPFEYESARLKLSGQVPQIPKLGISAEYEQALTDFGKKEASLGGDYQLPAGRVYVRHEFLSSLEGPYSLNGVQQQNTTVIGIDSGYMKGGSVFSEYRMQDAMGGRDAQAAIGLRNAWALSKGLTLNTSLERVQQLGGPAAQGTSTAVTGAVEYTADPRWKGTARLETHISSTDFSVLNTLGLAYKINNNFTFLGRNLINLDNGRNGTGDNKTQEWLQLGMAYRPEAPDVWNALAKYELKYNKDEAAGENTLTHIVSANVNYRPFAPFVLSGKYAGKLLLDNSNGLQSVSNTHMLGLWSTYDINSHWDAGVMTSALFTNFLKELQYGAGLEVGYLVAKDVWLSAGYNVFGFKDTDLAAEDYTNPGVYMRLRMKFDEGIFGMFSGKDKNNG